MFGRADFKVIILIMLMAIILAVTFALAYYYLINRPEFPDGTYETTIDGQTIKVVSDPRRSVWIISTPTPVPTGLPIIDIPEGQGGGETEENVTIVAPEQPIAVATPLPTLPPPPPPTFTPVPPTLVPVNQYSFVDYLVIPGDTLWSISQKHNTTIALMARFGIDATDIIPNTVIRIPIANPAYCPGTRAYVVESGDTLASIAQRTGTTVATLMEINGFGPNFRLDETSVICVPN